MRVKINILLAVLIAAGFIMMVAGYAMGGYRTMYFDRTGLRFSERRSSGGNAAGSGLMVSVSEKSLAKIESISVNLVDTDVFIIPADFNGIEMRYDENRVIEWELRNGTLTVSDKTNSSRLIFFGFSFPFDSTPREYIYIYCDAPSLRDVSFSSVSGDFNSDWIGAVNVSLNTVSGDIDIKNLRVSDRLMIETVSGDIFVGEGSAERAETSTVSGNMKLERFGVFDFKFVTISGDLRAGFDFAANKSDVRITTLSGDVTLDGARIRNRSDYGGLRSVGAQYKIELDSVSGDFDLRFK